MSATEAPIDPMAAQPTSPDLEPPPPSSPDTELSLPTEKPPQNAPELPTSDQIPSPTLPPENPREPRPLTAKQITAISLITTGQTDPLVCDALGIDRKTLYTWKHKHPVFIAELNRRQNEIWSVLAHRVRLTLLKAVDTFRKHLDNHDDDTALRAARALLPLIGAPRLAPTGPTDPNEILDQLLKAATPTTPGHPTPTLSDTDRQALLNHFLHNLDDDPTPTPATS